MSLTQLLLDIFGPAPAPAPAHPPSQATPPAPQATPPAPKPLAPVPRARPAAPAPAPAVPLPTLLLHECLAPAEFRHPQANRELLLPGAVVAYVLVRARRRSIGFTVSSDGLAVRAPIGSSVAAIETALRHKADWIVRKLAQTRALQQRQQHARIDWRDGAVLPYLGAPLQLRLQPGAPLTGTLHGAGDGDGDGDGSGTSGSASGSAEAAHAGPATLCIGLPAGASGAQLRDAVQAWLMRQAQAHFTARLNHFAPLLGVQWRSLRLSSAQTRWGSAKADGSIRLNWRLLHYRPAIIDYVVAHELSHLREMNHSRDFWRTVATVVPDHAELRRSLHAEPAPSWGD